MERLTIKEVAPYLPYKLNVKTRVGDKILEMMSLSTVTHKGQICIETYDGTYGDMWFNPLLRPLSSINLKWFQDNIDEALEDFRINCEPENNHFSVEVCEKVLGWSALSLEEYQLFYRDHVDIHGLIDRGLALPIDGKEVEGE